MERCVNFSIRKANRVLNQIYDSQLAKCGLKAGQYSILRALNELKESSNRDLQDILVIDQTTLTRGLKPLIRDGYIRSRAGEDQRLKVLSLSPQGKGLYKEATKHWRVAQKQVASRLGEVTLEQLFTLSDSVVALKN
ncbi:MAG: DNA-binding MarR family transcriptional regulator [Halioglobus sp.]|jgi:DNA-binding MarR family transcriptional regulator